MSSEIIKKDIEDFQVFVQKLGSGVGKAASLWRDAKFAELSLKVSEIANMSKEVIVSGERCCNSIDKFDKISAEKY